jgi:retron-type reverse transcriptase
MERAVERANAVKAFKRVRQNKGSPGIDGMTVRELEPYLRTHWPALREGLLAGSYQPSAVRRQESRRAAAGCAR